MAFLPYPLHNFCLSLWFVCVFFFGKGWHRERPLNASKKLWSIKIGYLVVWASALRECAAFFFLNQAVFASQAADENIGREKRVRSFNSTVFLSCTTVVVCRVDEHPKVPKHRRTKAKVKPRELDVGGWMGCLRTITTSR